MVATTDEHTKAIYTSTILEELVRHQQTSDEKQYLVHMDKATQIMSLVISMSREDVKKFVDELEKIINDDADEDLEIVGEKEKDELKAEARTNGLSDSPSKAVQNP